MMRRLAPILAGLLGVTSAAAQAPVRIGLSAPLTGPDAAFGLGLRQGAEQAVADLNRAAGGRPRWVLIPADDGGDGRQAVAVARKFTADGVRLVVGPLESGAVAAAAPAYEEAGAVMVAPGATYTPLTGRGLWNLFRLAASDAQQGRAAGAYLARAFAGRRVGIVNDRSTFGRGLADAVATRLKEAGTPEVLFESFARGTRDPADVVARLKAARIEAVYFGGLAPEAAALLRAMRDAGLSGTLVASDGILDPGFAAAAVGDGRGDRDDGGPRPAALARTARWPVDAARPGGGERCGGRLRSRRAAGAGRRARPRGRPEDRPDRRRPTGGRGPAGRQDPDPSRSGRLRCPGRPVRNADRPADLAPDTGWAPRLCRQ